MKASQQELSLDPNRWPRALKISIMLKLLTLKISIMLKLLNASPAAVTNLYLERTRRTMIGEVFVCYDFY